MKRKSIIMLLCAVIIISSAAFGTIAYLTDRAAITNRFTIGNVSIDMDETVVTPDGLPVDSDQDGVADRTSPDSTGEEGNTYHLMPGRSYTKDPVLTVKAGSEESYVRMIVTISHIDKVRSALGEDFLPENYVTGWDPALWPCAGITEGTKTIIDPDTQQENSVQLTMYEFRYHTTVVGADTDGVSADIRLEPLFETFTIPGTLTSDQLEQLQLTEIRVEGYAIQKDGFDDAEAAWAAFPEPTTNITTIEDQQGAAVEGE